jgi:hypothetical protein
VLLLVAAGAVVVVGLRERASVRERERERESSGAVRDKKQGGEREEQVEVARSGFFASRRTASFSRLSRSRLSCSLLFARISPLTCRNKRGIPSLLIATEEREKERG